VFDPLAITDMPRPDITGATDVVNVADLLRRLADLEAENQRLRSAMGTSLALRLHKFFCAPHDSSVVARLT
jgi:hypothetical protein